MAAKTLYLTDTVTDNWQILSETSPGTEATSSPIIGWVVGKLSPTVYSSFDSGNTQATGSFSGTAQPDGSLDTSIGDAFRAGPYSGDFANANWTINGVVIATAFGGSQDGNLGFRLFKGPNADGSSATEITAGTQSGAAVTNLDTTASQNSSVTFNPGAISLSNEYLFVQVGWTHTGAGSNNNSNVILRVGDTGTRIVTSDFGQRTSPSQGSVAYTGAAASLLLVLELQNGSESYTGQGNVENFSILGTVIYATCTDDCIDPLWWYDEGTALYTGEASTLSTGGGGGDTTTPDAGAKLYTGQQNSEIQTFSVLPDAGAKVYTGQSSVLDLLAGLGAGAEIYGGLQATEIQTFSVLPGEGSEVYTGQTSLLALVLAMQNGEEIYTGQQPAEVQTLSVLPGEGTKVYTGQQPTEDQTFNQWTLVSNGEEIYTGQQNSEIQTFSVLPGEGTKVYTGQQPTENQTLSALPGAGTEEYTGQQNSEIQTFSVLPGEGDEIYTGQQNSEIQTFSVLPGEGSEIYTGQTALLSFLIAISAGSKVYTGQQPTEVVSSLGEVVTPSQGEEIYTGQSNVVNYSVITSSGEEAYAGQTPSLPGGAPVTTLPGEGSEVYDGQTSVLNFSVISGQGSVVYDGQASTIQLQVQTSAGLYVYTGNASVLNSLIVSGQGSALYTGNASIATTTTNTFVYPVSGEEIYTGADSYLIHPHTADPTNGQVIYTGQISLLIKGSPLMGNSIEWIIFEHRRDELLVAAPVRSLH